MLASASRSQQATSGARPPTGLGVAFFPSTAELSGNPYWTLLRSKLEEAGVTFDDTASSTFSAGWLWRNRRRVQVLHFHWVQQFYAYQSVQARLRWVLRFARNLLMARALGYRTVFTLHDLTPTWPLRPAWVDYLGHWVAANLAHSVLVHCEYARQALGERFGRRARVHTVPHPHFSGVYANRVTRGQARARLGYSEHHTVFVFFGGIRPNKGIEKLIGAFRQTGTASWRLLIAGRPWPPMEYLERLAALADGDDRIRLFPQFVPDDEVQVYLNAADVVVLPFEAILGSSSTALAMSFGRPVVAPATGCLPEFVGPDAGLLYDPLDPDSLRMALLKCGNVDLQRMGELARDRAASFTWESMVAGTLVAYGREPSVIAVATPYENCGCARAESR